MGSSECVGYPFKAFVTLCLHLIGKKLVLFVSICKDLTRLRLVKYICGHMHHLKALEMSEFGGENQGKHLFQSSFTGICQLC